MVINAYIDKLAQVESGNDPLARNTKSSAKGRFQFIDATAKEYGITADFGTPEYEAQEKDAVISFTQNNLNTLEDKLGRKPSYGELYLAHQQGAEGAYKLLSNPDALAVDVLGKDQVLNNGGNEEMTASEYAEKWSQKFTDIDEQTKEVVEDDLYDLMGIDFGNETKEVSPQKEPDLYDLMGVKPDIIPEGDEILYQTDKAGNIQERKINKERGAPSYIRGIVGSASKPEDRLSTLRKYYPDAQPYEDNNFVFTDPETNELTLYNPKGLDFGDVASVTREGTIMAGSALGATFGAGVAIGGGLLVPAPEEVYTVPIAAAYGSGVGAGIAVNAYDALANLFGLRDDTRTPLQITQETGVEFALGAVGEKAGRAIAPATKKIISGGKATAQNVARQFRALGIDPTATTITGGKGLGRIEKGLEQSFAASDVIEKQTNRIVEQTQKATNKIIQGFGKAKTKEGVGADIRRAAQASLERFGAKQNDLYDEAFDLVGEGTKVQLKSVKQLLASLKTELAAAPTPKMKRAYSPAIQELETIIKTEGAGGFQFNALRSVRTNIGREIGDPLTRSANHAQLSRVYGALSEDMGATVSGISDEAARKISRADKYTKAFSQNAKDLLDKIIKLDADEKAYNFVKSASKDGGTSLRRLRKSFTADEWDVVSASVLNQMGYATAGAQNAAGDAFSVNTFLTNYNRLAPEAKDALFGGVRYKGVKESLDNLLSVAEKMKDVSRLSNTSNTAGSLQSLMFLNALGGVVGAGVGGDTEGAAKGLGVTVFGSILAPRMAAKLITNPEFVKWLAEPVEHGVSSIPAHLTRLIAIGEVNPEIKEEINEYIKVLELNTRD